MNYIQWTDDELKAAAINKKKLLRLLSYFSKCTELMKELDLMVYGSDGVGHLIHSSRPEHTKDGKADQSAIVATIGYGFDGGGW